MSTLSVMCLYELSVWKVTPVFSTTENLHPWEKVPLMIEESWWLIRQKHTLFIQLFKLKPNLIFLPLYKVLIRKVSYCCSTSVWKFSHSKLALKGFPCTFSMIQNLKCVTIYPMKTQQQISNCADWLFFLALSLVRYGCRHRSSHESGYRAFYCSAHRKGSDRRSTRHGVSHDTSRKDDTFDFHHTAVHNGIFINETIYFL